MSRLRRATVDDALLLYTWRCRAEQAPWYEGKPTSWEEHRDWFSKRLIDPLVRLLIWEHNRDPLGVIRIDSNGELAYYADNSRDAAPMIQAATSYAREYGGRLKITLDVDDTEGLEALAGAGFKTYPSRSMIYQGTA